MKKIVTMIAGLFALGVGNSSFGMTVGRNKLPKSYCLLQSSRKILPGARKEAFEILYTPHKTTFRDGKVVFLPIILPSEIAAKGISKHVDTPTLLNLRATSHFYRDQIRVEKLEIASSYLQGERALFFVEDESNALSPENTKNNQYLQRLFALIDIRNNDVDGNQKAKILLVGRCVPTGFDPGFYRYFNRLLRYSVVMRNDSHTIDLLKASPHDFADHAEESANYLKVVDALQTLAHYEKGSFGAISASELKAEIAAVEQRLKEYKDLFFRKQSANCLPLASDQEIREENLLVGNKQVDSVNLCPLF